jgi:hypothetical protein
MRRFHNGGFKVRSDLLKQWSYKHQIKAYHAGVSSDWNSPNSTDVHATKSVKNLMGYLCKYMLKDTQSGGIVSRLWGCSVVLSKAKGAVMQVDSFVSSCFETIRRVYKPFEYFGEHFSVTYLDFIKLARSDLKYLFDSFVSYIQSSFGYNILLNMSV